MSQGNELTRVLVVDRDDAMRRRMGCVAGALPGRVRVREVVSLEWAIDALSRDDFDLVVMASDLGVGTSAFINVVTLMGAGTSAAIAVHSPSPVHREAMALESIGISCYKASADVSPGDLMRLLSHSERAVA
jgi:hypothetical protein